MLEGLALLNTLNLFWNNTDESHPLNILHRTSLCRRSPEGLALLRALRGKPRPTAEAAASPADWRARALAVYREALSGGSPPRLHVLDRLLACLRELPPAGAASKQQQRPHQPSIFEVCARF